MDENLKNYEQEIDLDTESGAEWVIEDEQVDKKEPEKEIEENEKNKGELEEIENNIEEQQEKIDKLQDMLYYFESGEAYRENEEQYESGDITEEDYIANKTSLDLEFDQIKLDIKEATSLLENLFARKEQITGIREENNLEEEKVNQDLVNMANEEQERSEAEEKKVEQEKTGVENKEDIQDESKANPENQIFENSTNNINGSNNIQNNAQEAQVNGEDIDNSAQSNGPKDEQEQQDVDPNMTQQLDLYRKQNAFMSLVRKVIAKIKSFNDKTNTDKIEEIAVEEMDKKGANLDPSNLDVKDLGDSLSDHVCSKEEVINNINKRESLEKEEKEVDRNIDDVSIE